MKRNIVGDWRTELYDGELNGAEFRLKRFESTEENDHEHCIFCWKKITDTETENADKEGYCTYSSAYSRTEREIWVCKECFSDFNEQFDFKLKS